MNTLKFIVGEESRPKVEAINELRGSLFEDVYKKAFTIIEQYIKSEIHDEPLAIGNDNSNNIVSFIGERGSGKTSCMLSVANALLKEAKAIKQFLPESKFDKYLFLTVDLIDPSFFDDNSNILDIVLSKMFKAFKKEAESGSANCQNPEYIRKKRVLIDCFQKVKENIDVLQKTEEICNDSLDSLVNMAAGSDLKSNVNDLVEAYLDFFKLKDDHRRGMLLLCIDDVDLHTRHAYTMVEKIRKYLIHPNVLILIAVKLDQLGMVIRQHYIEDFKASLTEKQLDHSIINEMADRYVAKLIPLERRIYLPDMEVYMNQQLYVENRTDEKKNVTGIVRELVLSQIFQKTRYLFYNSKGKTSYIVPRNLRELRHLIALLNRMDDFEDNNQSGFNKTIFKKYFWETWVDNNLNVREQEIMRVLLGNKDAVNMNKLTVQQLDKNYSLYIPELSGYDKIVQDQNLSYNISLGDVMAIVSALEQRVVDIYSQKLFFAIKTHYSMLLYEYYDEITPDAEENVAFSRQEDENIDIKKANVEVLKREFMLGYSNYDKLSGGNFIHSMAHRIVPNPLQGEPRAQRQINGDLIFSLIKELKNSKNAPNVSVEIQGISYEITKIEALRLVEFFALTTSRRFDERKIGYRITNEIYYNTDLSAIRKNLWFDAASCLFNTIDMKRTYERFGDDLCALILRDDLKKSLCRQLTDKCVELRPHGSEELSIKHSCLSVACVRNVEVLDEFVGYLENHRPKGGDDIVILKDLWKNFSEFELPTYDIDPEKTEHYTIHFKHFEVLNNFLLEISNNEKLKVVFASIYNNINSSIVNSPDFVWNFKSFKRGGENKKTTILRKLEEQNPYYVNDPRFSQLLQENFPADRYNRYDADQICEEIKKMIESWTTSDQQ